MAHVGSLTPAFWAGRTVLVTGHTGFKGAWLSLWLHALGARVVGLSDGVPTSPSLFGLARVGEVVDGLDVDVRNSIAVRVAVAETRPSVVLHLAAQPLVRRSFEDPVGTYAVNVMGTANVLDAVRRTGGVEATVVVTSDKCYENRERAEGYREDEPMGGFDPYSSSKGAAELVTAAMRRSYDLPVASARAGNVIGGGDWAVDRLVPDLVRGAGAGEVLRIRNPNALRPWQHVLEPLSGYLLLAEAVAREPVRFAEGWNFGPADADARPVSWVVERLAERWPSPVRWEADGGPHPHEARLLALDSTKARERLGWTPRWDLATALDAIVDWHAAVDRGEDARAVSRTQIDAFARIG